MDRLQCKMMGQIQSVQRPALDTIQHDENDDEQEVEDWSRIQKIASVLLHRRGDVWCSCVCKLLFRAQSLDQTISVALALTSAAAEDTGLMVSPDKTAFAFRRNGATCVK
ncbi:hypothetical protein BDEG_24188 [Batrachochytrium dendrobatidis JEL423]|uniref:Uncharacterized protein n=1 Tax=Batrachochytrium dendrobatidis (strain JEL423) TaxID=403673 RepID=A0A177WL98_BATDL|nr:hypothetical protein BDEG_24188 [Batrachochytrium dendrobatidis JEL423]